MATLNALYNEATLSTERWYSRKVNDLVFNSNPFAMILRRDARTIGGGESLEMPGMFDTATGEWFGEYDTYSAAAKEQIGAGRLDWKLYTVPVVLSHLQLLKNAESRERRFDLAAQKNMVAAKTAANDLGSATFNLVHNEARKVDSLDLAVSNATATGNEVNFQTSYAGISRVSGQVGNTVWVANVDDASTTLSMSTLQTNYGLCQEGDEKSTIAVTTQTNFNRYWNLLTPIQRLGSDEMGKAGFTSLMFNGIPVVVDSHVPKSGDVPTGGSAITADYWYFLNMNHVELAAHKMAFFTFERAVMPTNQWVHIGRYFFVGNILVDNPRYHGKLSALTA